MSLSKQVEGPYRKEGHPRSDSLGNQAIFHELKRRKREPDEVEPFEKREREEILRLLQSYSFQNKCCEKNRTPGCFLGAFVDGLL